MAEVIIYTSAACAYCMQAKRLFDEKNVEYQELRIDEEPQHAADMFEKSGRKSVPQIFINDQHIGGFDELDALDKEGGLDPLLAK